MSNNDGFLELKDFNYYNMVKQGSRSICNRRAQVFGVMDTGTRSVDGAGLEWIDENGNIITLTKADFDAHPAFNFPEVIVGGNYFRSIPRAYWKRGIGPSGSDSAGKWCMWISDVPLDGFKSNPGAFKRSGSWLDHFLWGTYRAFNDGGVPGSKPGKTHWSRVSWQAFKNAAASIGEGHHMISLQEWHEILGRAAIEKKTFQLVPEASRQNASLCKYRGIEEFAFSGSTSAEWMDGARTDASGKYELWTEAGGNYSSTGVTCPQGGSEATYYNQGLVTGGLFDHLFFGASLGPASTSFIPDYSGRPSSVVGRFCYSYFYAGYAWCGAFNSVFHRLPSDEDADIGSRLAKW